MIDSIGDSLIAEVREMENHPDMNKKLYNILQKHISEIEQRQGIPFQVIAEVISLGDKALNSKTSNILHQYIAELQILLEDGVKKGEFRQNLDTQSAATLLFSIIHGLVNLWYLSEYDFNLKGNYENLWKTYCKVISPNGDDTFVLAPLVVSPPS
ncbi:MAG: TetR/AcrR family transcriptional regulator C-terminal domain-containing protein [Dehalococcoidales bacterium]|nr:TetR/AcrR family transcriptional regulator C-terminal domain-containing protein [Dehalococcoidales bacterium]